MTEGIIKRVNGPIVDAIDMADAFMSEVVEVGSYRLIGEVIRIRGDLATIQVYENTSGLKIYDKVYRTFSPLKVSLGPGLIANIFDGIQRPLRDIRERSGAYIKRGEKVTPLNMTKKWHFKPTRKNGEYITGGFFIGEVPETVMLTHKIMIPPDKEGTIKDLVPEGEYTLDDVICTLIDKDNNSHQIKMYQDWPVRVPRPFKSHKEMNIPLVTGQRIIDTFFPLAKGGTAAIPGGFGTGKTMIQHALAKWSDADIIIYIGCGERGNEMTDVLTEFPKLIDPRSGQSLSNRTVMIANTSNMPVAAREVSIYTGVTIGEYYRDMGYHVAVMADSTSRWAEALRELGGRLEEMPAEEGFPAYLPTRLAQFYERAGMVETLSGYDASVTIGGSVSPPGGDFSEPVTQHTRRFIRCFWALDRDLANARHYPAISWLSSYSEYIPDIEDWWKKYDIEWKVLRDNAINILQREDKLQNIVKLVGPDALPDSQKLILFIADIIKNAFLQQSAFDENDMYALPLKQVKMLRTIMNIHNKSEALIRKGIPLITIKELSSIPPIMRMKFTISNTQIEKIDELSDKFNHEIEDLERRFAK